MFKRMISILAVAGLVLALAPAVSQAIVITLDDVLDQTGSYNTTVDLTSHNITGEESVYLTGTMTYDVLDTAGYQCFQLRLADGGNATWPGWGKNNNAAAYGLWYPYPLYYDVDTELTTGESHEVVFKWNQTGANAGDWSYWFNPDLSMTEAEVAATVSYPNDIPGHQYENQSPLVGTGIVESANYFSNNGDSGLEVDYTGFAIYTGDDTPFAATVTAVPGDVDGDGNVDLADVGFFEAQFGQSGLPLPPGANSADLDADGDVDLDDLVFIRDNYGFVSPAAPSASSATPEPATMTLLALGGMLVPRRRRRKA